MSTGLCSRRALILIALAGCGSSDTFQVDAATTPLPPLLRSPMANAYVGSVAVASSFSPTFRWVPQDGALPATSYVLQISTDFEFETSLVSVTTQATEAVPREALPVSREVPVGTRYYWRVQSCIEGQCSRFSPARRLNLGRSDRDLNGDGLADIIVSSEAESASATIYFGRRDFATAVSPAGTLTAPTGSRFEGRAVTYAGDVNDDGFGDVLAGAPSDGAGTVLVYFGGPGEQFDATPDRVLHGEAAGDRFGAAAAAAGDVDGDGAGDIAVGAPQSRDGAGAVYVFSAAIRALPISDLHGNFVRVIGRAVAPAGDVDDDGFADVVVSANAPNGASGYVLFGAQAGQPPGGSLPLSHVGVGQLDGGQDVNGDGFADVLVTGPGIEDSAKLFFGGAERSLYGRNTALYGETNPGFGEEVALTGDVDGDGYADVLVGANYHALGSRGGAYLYHGGPPSNFSTIPVSTLTPASSPSTWRVYAPGDVNGDGLTDVVVSGTDTQVFAGGARVFEVAPLITLP